MKMHCMLAFIVFTSCSVFTESKAIYTNYATPTLQHGDKTLVHHSRTLSSNKKTIRRTVSFTMRLNGFKLSTFGKKDQAKYIGYMRKAVKGIISVKITGLRKGSVLVDTLIIFPSLAVEKAFATALATGRILPKKYYKETSLVGNFGLAVNAVNKAAGLPEHPCAEDCPYSYPENKKICGSCCPDYGKRKCPAYASDYNGCGPGNGNNDGSNGQINDGLDYAIQGLISFVGGTYTAELFDPICNNHDICYQNPTKNANECNNALDTQLTSFCNIYYNPSKASSFSGSSYYFWQDYFIHRRAACWEAAKGVVFFVRKYAKNFYNINPAKKYAKRCCNHPPPPPSPSPPPPPPLAPPPPTNCIEINRGHTTNINYDEVCQGIEDCNVFEISAHCIFGQTYVVCNGEGIIQINLFCRTSECSHGVCSKNETCNAAVVGYKMI